VINGAPSFDIELKGAFNTFNIVFENENLEKKLQSFSNVVGFFYKPFNFDDVEEILSKV